MDDRYQEFRAKLMPKSAKAIRQMADEAGHQIPATGDKDILLSELWAAMEGLPSPLQAALEGPSVIVAEAPKAQEVGPLAVPKTPDLPPVSDPAASGSASDAKRAVRAIQPHWRCGRRWTIVRALIPVSEFSADDWDRLRADPLLQVRDK